MRIFRQLLNEFWLPLAVAFCWTVYNVLEKHNSKWVVADIVNIFGPTFFFVSWTLSQWYRVKKQQKVDEDLESIRDIIQQLHEVVATHKDEIISAVFANGAVQQETDESTKHAEGVAAGKRKIDGSMHDQEILYSQSKTQPFESRARDSGNKDNANKQLVQLLSDLAKHYQQRFPNERLTFDPENLFEIISKARSQLRTNRSNAAGENHRIDRWAMAGYLAYWVSRRKPFAMSGDTQASRMANQWIAHMFALAVLTAFNRTSKSINGDISVKQFQFSESTRDGIVQLLYEGNVDPEALALVYRMIDEGRQLPN